MATKKFLDYDGLQYFWGKIKTWVNTRLLGKQDKLTFDTEPTVNSYNPVTSGGIATAISGFITKAVDDLTNYYLKSETYTKDEVAALIGAIDQFSYEIAASTSAVTNPKSNVLYLIGPTGSGSDKYEEYVYPNSTAGWTKIGDTSIDLSNYYTKAQADAAFAPVSKCVPTGGTAGQVLVKHSNTDNDVEWGNAGVGSSTDVQVNGTSITSGGVANIVTETAYDASSNKIATMSDLPSVPVTDVTVGGTSVVSSGTAVIPQEIFVATYGTTTYQQIVDANTAGKAVICLYNGHAYSLTNVIAQYAGFSAYWDKLAYLVKVTNADVWSDETNSLQSTYDRVSSWQSTPDNNHYPSEKLVKDYVDGICGDIQTILISI